MAPRVKIACPHCGQVFAQNLFSLSAGMWRHCPGCGGAIRITAVDIRRLWQAIWRRRP
ncbi:MAG: hypothetical protein IH614_14975 [Desulfuromonadales bacterium]|nr:hypothetical protein [Desulfuromonadales bacterium]